MCNIEKHINTFYKKIQGVKVVLVQEDWNITMIIKIKCQINRKYTTKRLEKEYYYRKGTIDVFNLET